MLRSLLHSCSSSVSSDDEPSSAVFVRLCHAGDWDQIIARTQQTSSHWLSHQQYSTSCCGGASITALLQTAVRHQCPQTVVATLLQQNPALIAIPHRVSGGGTILHHAIQHGCSNEVIAYLIDKMVEYCQQQSNNDDKTTTNLLAVTDARGRTALHCWIERCQRFYSDHNNDDDDGATAAAAKSNLSMYQVFEKLVTAYPEAIGVAEDDRNTPLILLLSTHRSAFLSTNDDDASYCLWQEEEIFYMVQFMISVSSLSAATTDQKTPGKWRYHKLQQRQESTTSLLRLHNQQQGNNTISVSAIASMTPLLYYALLHGRSVSTIELLLQVHRNEQLNASSSMILSQYHEVGLHIAVTVSADTTVLKVLLQDYPAGVTVQDTYGLTPLDWLWIRHVQDFGGGGITSQQQQQQPHHHRRRHRRTPFTSRVISRRRHLPTHFLEWYRAASASCVIPAAALLKHTTTTTTTNCKTPSVQTAPIGTGRAVSTMTRTVTSPTAATSTSPTAVRPERVLRLQDDLFHRLKLLLKAAAATAYADDADHDVPANSKDEYANDDEQSSWSLVHAACYVPIPLAMLRLVLAHHNNGNITAAVRVRDNRAGRYPLHYAVGRGVGYTASYPVGISRGLQTVHEPSPVHTILPLFPQACRATDRYNQLPLHIAIDAFKKYRLLSPSRFSRNESAGAVVLVGETETDEEEEEDRVLELLLSSYPTSIQRRDGKSMLYPWQQASVGRASRLTTVYRLLRRQPTILMNSGS